MEFLFFGALLLIPLSTVVYTVYSLVVRKHKANIYDKPSSLPYATERTRGSVRQSMGRVKSLADFYSVERDIKFP